MKLYHGSTVNIEKIDLAKSKPNKDFGPAFYLSVDEQQAFDVVYTSRLFEKLDNPATGLYFQSSGYVYSFLQDELDK
ncbi:MAG: DUF3990 domain-containing protein [Bacteroidales bacterium]|nr:DUF3990 domain-containing protein [Bacteroidales bacterium]